MSASLVRTYEPQLERIDKRTVGVTIVPYNERAEMFDVLDDGSIDHYWEAMAPEVFAAQTRSTDVGTLRRISFVDEHEGGIGKLGYVLAARELPTHLESEMRVLRSREADLDEMIEDGIDKISVRFLPLRGGTREEPDGLRVRTRAHIEHVALVAEGAYAGAAVTRSREAELERVAASAAADLEAQMAETDAWLAAERDRWAALRA